jgi:hypothetical protein
VTGIDRTLEEMVWRVVTRYAELAGVEVVSEPSLAYGMLDGVFQQALLGYHAGRDDALARLRDQARRVLCLAVGAED